MMYRYLDGRLLMFVDYKDPFDHFINNKQIEFSIYLYSEKILEYRLAPRNA